MCVTNITVRRPQPITLPDQHQATASCSSLTARLLGNFELKVSQPNEPQHRYVGSIPYREKEAYGNCPMNGNDKPRRRKPQKPGKTAKHNERHFVVHNYCDHAYDEDCDPGSLEGSACRASFPYKLHDILDKVERDGLDDVISWQPHGRCFIIHKPKEFVQSLMPSYFGQTKFTSFQRQLNLYGFSRLTRGEDAGGYYHELFLRGKVFLVKRMTRTKVKGTKYKAASSPDQEPNFYRMDPVIVSLPSSPMSSPLTVRRNDCDSLEVATVLHGEMCSFSLNPPSMVAKPIPLDQMFSMNSALRMQSLSNLVETGLHAIENESESDDLLDEAVKEIFHDGSHEAMDINDFNVDWSPITNVDSDVDLGWALDSLLETMSSY